MLPFGGDVWTPPANAKKARKWQLKWLSIYACYYTIRV